MNQLLSPGQRHLRFFSDREAWNLFRLAAFGEALGWTLLGSGILIVRYLTPHNNDAVQIAGQIHGLLFIAYFIASLALASSLGWSKLRTLTAAAMSVMPYGTLLFEKWEAVRRDHQHLKSYRKLYGFAVINQAGRYLAVQPSDSSQWKLPGGEVGANETSQQALERLVSQQLGLKPKLGSLLYIREFQHKKVEYLELYFAVTNSSAYAKLNFAASLKNALNVDEISFVNPKTEPLLQPAFLQQTVPGQPPTAPQIISQ